MCIRDSIAGGWSNPTARDFCGELSPSHERAQRPGPRDAPAGLDGAWLGGWFVMLCQLHQSPAVLNSDVTLCRRVRIEKEVILCELLIQEIRERHAQTAKARNPIHAQSLNEALKKV